MPRPLKGNPNRSTAIREEMFVKNWFALSFNAKQAAIAIGHPEKSAAQMATEYLIRPSVQALVVKEQERLILKHDVSIDNLVLILRDTAKSNMKDYMRDNGDGTVSFDFTNVTREQWSAIAEITVDEYTEGRGENQREIKRTRLKLHNKNDSIDKLLRIFGAYVGKEAPVTQDNRTQIVNNVNLNTKDAADAFMQMRKIGNG